MKKIFTIWLGIILSLTFLIAQDAPPQAFSYKATIINTKSGAIVASKTVGIRISILQNSSAGFAFYTETFRPTTNLYGQVDIVIGRGTVVSGNFSTIPWSNDLYFLKTEVDIKGGTNYQLMSVAQLLSVPYALYSGVAGLALSADYNSLSNRPTNLSQFNNDEEYIIDETDPLFSVHPSKSITTDNIVNWNAAYGWGNHSLEGYALSDSVYTKLDLQTEGNSEVNWNNLTNKPVFAKVATTGNYSDLNNLPVIPTSLNQITPDAGNRIITNVADPVSAQDAATKIYVDALKERVSALEKLLGVVDPTSIVTDIDGNTYDTVMIGTQIWMKQNLKVTRYRNGDSIPNVSGPEWSTLSSGAYCWYNNDTSFRKDYGAWYNYYAVSDSQNICPTGWHVPTDGEWTTLVTYLGGENVAGNYLKESGSEHWQSPNTGATNGSRFTALPGGVRDPSGAFGNNGYVGFWWSSTEVDTDRAFFQRMFYSDADVTNGVNPKTVGSSVRCIKGEASAIVLTTISTQAISNITSTGAMSGGTVTNNSGTPVISQGVCWNMAPNPAAVMFGGTSESIGTGSFTSTITGLMPNTSYNVRAYVTTSQGTSYGEQLTFTTSVGCFGCETGNEVDADGNTFKTIKIGDQWWMAENLKTTKYADGTPIQLVTTNTEWANLSTSGYSWYSNDEATYKNTYGALYNGYAIADSRNICPTGWHVPTRGEWTILTSYLQGPAGPGSKLKESGSEHWQSPNTGATNESGFTALPGGTRNPDGTFVNIGMNGLWWSATENDPNNILYVRLYYNNGNLGMPLSPKKAGLSVRCIKGEAVAVILPTVTTLEISNITSTGASTGGTVTDDAGLQIVNRGVCWNSAPYPSLANSNTSEYRGGIGSFTSIIGGLVPNRTYYVRAYATNGFDVAYGNEIIFNTVPGVPILSTNAINSITATTAVSGGNIGNDGGAPVTERGVCWNTSTNPTTDNFKTTDGSGTGNFISNITGLTAGSTYYVRSYATNSLGTGYGSVVSFMAGIPTLNTLSITSISATTANSGGNISNEGGAPVTARGVCWSTSANPTTASNKTIDGSGPGNFVSTLTGLTAGTIYYVRAYATNSFGTAYGSNYNFMHGLPFITTTAISSITATSATSGGNIPSDGGFPIIARGVCWSTSTNPTTANNKTMDGTETGSFISNITGLITGSIYYVRSYATNSIGTAYGAVYNFIPGIPTLNTLSITSITATSATSGGNIPSDGGFPVIARGVCWNTAPNPTISNNKTTDGSGTGSFVSSLTGLTSGTIYYVRAYATNSTGTAYGSGRSFITNAATISTNEITFITATSATSGGNIPSDGGFPIIARGVCWNTTPNPTIANNKTTDGSGTGTFVSSLTGLSPGTTYFVRAYSTNSSGTSYGNAVSFTTSMPGIQVTDIDGNIYNTIAIGTQVWMVENLKTTRYRNGDLIGTTTPATLDITGESTPKYQWAYADIDSNVIKYGRLYTWFAATDSRNVCPTGWHVATDTEWTTLTTYLGGESVAGDKLKETGITHWPSPNTGATNESGFTALPGGCRYSNVSNGGFSAIGTNGFWWSSTNFDSEFAWYRYIGSNSSIIGRGNAYRGGFSVRCLQGEGQFLPVVTTDSVSSIASTSAICGGNITSDGGAPVTARGVCYGVVINPTIANSRTLDTLGTGPFVSYISSLTPNTTYYIRAYATNSVGTAYGNEVSFTTSAVTPVVPTLSTTAITSITATTASSGGNITSDGGSPILTRGICWSTSANPTILNPRTWDGITTGVFTSSLTGLTLNTTYYVRAYATNIIGTAYGNEISFTTIAAGTTVTDNDGNVYNTITIGTQTWMVENLKTTKYNDGTPISYAPSNTYGSYAPYYMWYNNDPANKNPYGALYSWGAVNTGKLAPTGWHVATLEEWTTLSNYLGGASVAGGKLKEAGLTHWSSPNIDATNESGFTALPSGLNWDGSGQPFSQMGTQGQFWTSTDYESSYRAWYFCTYYDMGMLGSSNDCKWFSMAVRCIRNTP